jgi:RimJ/RimL family protein N-acetyltransferase
VREINHDNYFWQEDNVRLRAVRDEDWEGHYYNRFDTPARRLLQYRVELPPTISEARQFVEKYREFAPDSGLLMFTIETLGGDFVGGCNINNIDQKNGTFSVGMQVDRDHRGKGYGTAAMRILLRYAFLELRLNKWYGSVLDGNTASIAMLKKLGCAQEGVRRQMVYTDGKYLDEILFGLTKEEFCTYTQR